MLRQCSTVHPSTGTMPILLEQDTIVLVQSQTSVFGPKWSPRRTILVSKRLLILELRGDVATLPKSGHALEACKNESQVS